MYKLTHLTKIMNESSVIIDFISVKQFIIY